MRIALHGLTKAYGGLMALDEVRLDIEPGQIIALLGPNGAGKTTLLRCLGAVAAPDRGTILYDEQGFHRGRIDLRRRVGFLPEFPFVYPEMKVLRHVAMVLRLYGADGEGSEDRVLKLLRDFDLLPLADLPFATLSRGQAYKSALVAILAADPELWLLDEPFASGMDPNGIIALKEAARAAAARGRTVIYSTQILDIAETFCDRVCVIDRGRVRAFDRLEDLKARAGGKDGVLEALFKRLREERR
jgi:ABC-type multidrug transport system ATPase subunit